MRPAGWLAALAIGLAAGDAAALPQGGGGEGGGGTDPGCTDTHWYVQFCADESYTQSGWTETITANAVGWVAGSLPDTAAKAFEVDTGDSVDIVATLETQGGGDGAAAGLLDLERLAGNRPELIPDLLDVKGKCKANPNSPACKAAMAMLAGKVKQKDIEDASLFGHGCKHASDTVTRSVSGIGPGRKLAAFASVADADSVAFISMTLTHSKPRMFTTRVCRTIQGGSLPAPGHYSGRRLGSVTITPPAPQHGGTMSNFYVSASSAKVKGTITVNSNIPGTVGDVILSGDVLGGRLCAP